MLAEPYNFAGTNGCDKEASLVNRFLTFVGYTIGKVSYVMKIKREVFTA
jgi:hypothetical protein